MSNINFTIRKVFAGSPAQKNVGIHATFTMTIDGPDGIIVQLNDMKLMQTRDGTYYVDSAFRSYEGKDKETGEAKKIKINYSRLFPEKENWDKKDAIVNMVIEELGKLPAQAGRPAIATTKPASPSTSAPAGDPW
mgnify:CR=1 FL=1|tara:strand:- start:175917 stop:176321 length:405 start_codon:yes stop_codon:yes gene_type:complete